MLFCIFDNKSTMLVCSNLLSYPSSSSISQFSLLIIVSGRELSGGVIVDITRPVVCMEKNVLKSSDFSVQQSSLCGVFCDVTPGQKGV